MERNGGCAANRIAETYAAKIADDATSTIIVVGEQTIRCDPPGAR